MPKYLSWCKKKNPLEFVQSEANEKKKKLKIKEVQHLSVIFEYILDFTLYELLLIDTLNYMLYDYLHFAPHLWNLPPAQSSCFFHSKESWVFYIRCLIWVISEEGFRSEGHSMAGNGRHTHSIWVVSMKDGENVILY